MKKAPEELLRSSGDPKFVREATSWAKRSKEVADNVKG